MYRYLIKCCFLCLFCVVSGCKSNITQPNVATIPQQKNRSYDETNIFIGKDKMFTSIFNGDVESYIETINHLAQERCLTSNSQRNLLLPYLDWIRRTLSTPDYEAIKNDREKLISQFCFDQWILFEVFGKIPSGAPNDNADYEYKFILLVPSRDESVLILTNFRSGIRGIEEVNLYISSTSFKEYGAELNAEVWNCSFAMGAMYEIMDTFVVLTAKIDSETKLAFKPNAIYHIDPVTYLGPSGKDSRVFFRIYDFLERTIKKGQ